MATANIKITALSDITSANMTYNDLVAVVDMNGTPETKKANIQLVGNLILNGAGGSYFPAAAQAVLAQSVTNAAQPNITSVGTLSSLAVTANVTAGNVSVSGTVNGVLVGEGGNISNVQVGNIAGLGNIATINLDGNVSNVFRGDGTFGPEGAGGNANYANFAGTAYAVDGANVSGEVGFAAVANAVALANVSGAGNIASINLDGNVSNVLRGDGTWDSDANSTYGDSNVVSLLGAFGSNTIVTTGDVTLGNANVQTINVDGFINGDGFGISNVPYANITGTPTLGNVSTINLDGNASNILHGDGTWSADATDYSNANVVSLLASFGSNTISTTGLITGDGGGLSNVVGANVSGEVGFAAVANSVAYANVSGTPTLGNVSALDLDGNVANVLRGDGTFGADANSSYGDSNVVSLLGSFGSNTITTTGLITGDGGGLSNIAVANVTGLGNIATTNFDGNAANYLDGTGSWGAISTYGDSNVVSLLGAFGSNAIVTTGNISAGNVNSNVNGFSIGYLEVPQVSLTADDTIALEDSGKHFHSNTAGNITLTIPTNATVAFPVGTAISIVEEAAGNILVNAAAGVNLYLAGNSTAANRVLGSYGMATIMKVGSDTWFINGTGVS